MSTPQSNDQRLPGYGAEAAFPRPHTKRITDDERPTILLPEQWGLTKRELFAAMAMQGCLASGDDVTDAVGRGLRASDALLTALDVSGEK